YVCCDLHSFPTRRSSDLGHLPRQILCPSCRIEIAVSFMARRGRYTAPWLSSVRCLGPVTIVSPFLILSGDSHPAISEHHRHASRSEEHTSELQSREKLVC